MGGSWQVLQRQVLGTWLTAMEPPRPILLASPIVCVLKCGISSVHPCVQIRLCSISGDYTMTQPAGCYLQHSSACI